MPDNTAIDTIDQAFLLPRITEVVRAYPTIAGVQGDTPADIMEGYYRVRANSNLASMCLDMEKRILKQEKPKIEAIKALITNEQIAMLERLTEPTGADTPGGVAKTIINRITAELKTLRGGK